MMIENEPGPLSQVFNQQGAILVIFGALGGLVRSLSLKTTYRETLRVVIIGSATAFGFGSLTPVALKRWIGEIPAELIGTIGLIASGAFLVGLLAVVIIERLIAGKLKK
jgi:asparagine N-glycosylation enzyme membrane subunit Stt3